MPNRGELAIPVVRAKTETASADGAWAIIGFCAIGWTLSIYMAVSHLGADAIARLMSQATLG